jgi:5'(3')-deoxyribonucleotidase
MTENSVVPRRIAVDFDSTLADSMEVVIQLMNFKHGLTMSKNEITQWDWPTMLGRKHGLAVPEELDRDFWKIYDMFDRTHLRRMVPPTDPLACASVKWLVKRGHAVHIVTSNHADADESIRSWLFGHGLELPLTIIGRKSPHEKLDLDYDLFIDDAPALAEAATQDKKKLVLLVPQPWNRNIAASPNVRTDFCWRHALDIFEEMGL